jgi:hypothetical protein
MNCNANILNNPAVYQDSQAYIDSPFPNPANYIGNYQQYGNVQSAFNPLPQIQTNGIDPRNMFSNNGFVNKNEMMFNNYRSSLLVEDVKEYSVFIDSKDRNYQVYPNPFEYTVTLKPLGNSVSFINGEKMIYEATTPYILDKFENIKYIKLETILLPYHYKLDNDTADIDKSISLLNNLYTLVNIDELEKEKINKFSTNDVLMRSFAVIYPDGNINGTHFKGITRGCVYQYPPDRLGKLDKLTIKITDPYGNVFRPDHLKKSIKTSSTMCTCKWKDDECYLHSLYHPLNPQFQHHIQLKIGIVEPRFNKINFN